MPPDMIFFLCKVFADKPVLAYKAEDERFDTQTAQTHFAVRHDEARLNHIAHANFCLDAAINDLQVQVRRSDFAGFNLRALHFLYHWKHCRTQFQIIQATIAVGKESTNFTVKNANHAPFGFLVEPSVDVLVEQVGNLTLHFLIVAKGNVEAGGDLLMGKFTDSKAICLAFQRQVQGRAVGS